MAKQSSVRRQYASGAVAALCSVVLLVGDVNSVKAKPTPSAAQASIVAGLGISAIFTAVARRRSMGPIAKLLSANMSDPDLFMVAPTPMWVVDLETGRFRDVNLAAERLYGYDRDKFLELGPEHMRPEPDAARYREAFLAFHEHEDRTTIARHAGSDGRAFYVLKQSHDLMWDGRRSRMSVIIDLAEVLDVLESDQHSGLQTITKVLEDLSQSIEDGLVLIDSNLRVTHVNQMIEAMLQRPVRDLLSRSIWTVFPGQRDGPLSAAVHGVILSGRSITEEIRDDASGTWWKVTIYPVHKGAALLLRDVTIERTQAMELQRQSLHLETMINNTVDSMYAVDTDFRLLVANDVFRDRWKSITGTDISYGDKVIDTERVQETVQRFVAYYQRAFAGETFTVLETIPRLDMPPVYLEVSFRPMVLNGTIIGACSSSHDVTKRIETENELRKYVQEVQTALQRYELLMDATHDVVWEWVSAENATYWNIGLERTFGHALTKTVGDWWFEHIHPEDLEGVKMSFSSWLTSSSRYWSASYRLRSADGEYRYVLDRGVRQLNETGGVQRVIGSIADVHDQTTQLQHIQRQNEILRHIATVGAHQLRGPLTTMMGLLHLAQQDQGSEDRKEAVLLMLRTTARTLDEAITRFVKTSYDVEHQLDHDWASREN